MVPSPSRKEFTPFSGPCKLGRLEDGMGKSHVGLSERTKALDNAAQRSG